jgi:hypothetical protein
MRCFSGISRLSFFGLKNEVKVYEFHFAKWLLVVHNAFNCCKYWLHMTPGNCYLPSCWSAGSGFCVARKSVTCALKLYVQCVLLVLIRNFFIEGVLGLVSRYSRTLLFYNSELFKRKRIDRARVDNKVDSQMFMLPVI